MTHQQQLRVLNIDFIRILKRSNIILLKIHKELSFLYLLKAQFDVKKLK